MVRLTEDCEINIQKLIATRMLINANSGGGKSWAIRKFLEESHGRVQQIILDLEGEFISLREKYDYLLVGKEGEIPANIRTAELLARRLLELKVSTVIDLSELKHPERITFVKRFLDSLVNSPKHLWHPAIVVVDEAHQFCPEKAKSESMSAVIDLMTRGRKRGFCGVLATQRISKLHKDAAAECNNQMIGRTGLDIDMKRAGDILGFTKREDIMKLRSLKAGQFYLYGAAFNHDGIKKVKIGAVKTTHPDRTRGIEAMESSPTPENIKKIMKDLVDLPKEAEEELRTTKELRNKIKELKTKLTIAEKAPNFQRIDKKEVIRAKKEELERVEEKGYNQGYKRANLENKEHIDFLSKENALLVKNHDQIAKLLSVDLPKRPTYERKTEKVLIREKAPIINDNKLSQISTQSVTSKITTNTPLRAGAMKMLGWLAGAFPNSLTKQRIATLSGFSVKGGTFNTYISELKRNGWINGNGKELMITEEGLQNAEMREIPSGEELLQLWQRKFRAGAGKILQCLYEAYPESLSKTEIGYQTGFEPSGGTFNTYLSELRRNNLIEVNGAAGIRISQEFFE